MMTMTFKPQLNRQSHPEVVREAREWIDTPADWQQSCKGAGTDCKGLLEGVLRELGRPEARSPWAIAKDYKIVQPKRLLQGLAEIFDPVDGALPGDFVVFLLKGQPRHLGIVTEAADGMPTHAVHVYASGPRRVREIKLGSMVESIHSIWALRD